MVIIKQPWAHLCLILFCVYWELGFKHLLALLIWSESQKYFKSIPFNHVCNLHNFCKFWSVSFCIPCNLNIIYVYVKVNNNVLQFICIFLKKTIPQSHPTPKINMNTIYMYSKREQSFSFNWLEFELKINHSEKDKHNLL